ncbi:MAG: hypothetical protein KC656_17460 [Myxococcales bacterium]|nr:hypothetical protein [Myxococcales bacterium]MCB9670737.1 hypothetical protein [Alphaproteobacteria bacterium]
MLTVLLFACSAEAPAPGALDWMLGCWTDGSTEECWSREGDVLVGRNGSETMRIRAVSTGVVYEATPAPGSTTTFHQVREAADTVVFEAPEHDFPQRIVYARAGDTLSATISLLDGGKSHTWSWKARPSETSREKAD